MASFIGSMAQGVGRGLIAYGDRVYSGELQAIRQNSIEKRWKRQDAQRAEDKAESDRRYEEGKAERKTSREENTRRYEEGKASRAADRAQRADAKKLDSLNASIAAHESQVRKQLAKAQESVASGELSPDQFNQLRDELVGGFEKSTRHKLTSSGAIGERSFYRDYFSAKSSNEEMADGSPPNNSGDNFAELAQEMDAKTRNTSPPEAGRDLSTTDKYLGGLAKYGTMAGALMAPSITNKVLGAVNGGDISATDEQKQRAVGRLLTRPTNF